MCHLYPLVASNKKLTTRCPLFCFFLLEGLILLYSPFCSFFIILSVDALLWAKWCCAKNIANSRCKLLSTNVSFVPSFGCIKQETNQMFVPLLAFCSRFDSPAHSCSSCLCLLDQCAVPFVSSSLQAIVPWPMESSEKQESRQPAISHQASNEQDAETPWHQ
jgi:hypothetical protein